MTVTICPATTSDPVRAGPLVLAATVNCTVPLPAPVGVFTVRKPVAACAVQVQVAADAVTVTDEVVAVSATETVAGATVNVHGGIDVVVVVDVVELVDVVAGGGGELDCDMVTAPNDSGLPGQSLIISAPCRFIDDGPMGPLKTRWAVHVPTVVRRTPWNSPPF